MDQHAGDENRRDYKKRSPREAAYHAIDGERDYQDKKWGDVPHETAAFVAYIQEYTNQLVKASATIAGAEATLHAMRKVAALCVACMEQHGAPLRE